MADAVKEYLVERNKAMTSVFNDGNLEKLTAFYTENATIMPHNSHPIEGIKNITSFLAEFLRSRPKLEHEKTEFFELMSDNKACTNEFFACYDNDGKLLELFHDFFLWKKIDGEWYIDREVVNNRPMPKYSCPAHKEIEDRIRTLFDAFNRDDYDAVVAIYTEDASCVPHEGEIATGRQALKDCFSVVIPEQMKTLVLERVYHFEQLNENTAYSNSDMKSITDNGKMRARFRDCLIWTKIDGEWFIKRDFYHSLPMPKE